jgi:hypothetical protein
MTAVFLAWMLAQSAACGDEARAAMADAAARVQQFDVAGAIDRLGRDSAACDDEAIAMWYLRGLAAAREAYRDGGSPESLAPVKDAIAALAARGAGLPGQAQIAQLVLLAASAAAQSERDEMAVFLDEALRIEGLQIAAHQPGAPMIAAHEVAGDLWLQVHRFEDARRTYQDASELLGSTSRITLGLARTAARLQEPSACGQYRALIQAWGARTGEPPEIAEARAYVRSAPCQAPPAPPPSR